MLPPALFLTFCAIAVLAVAAIRRVPEGQIYTLRRLDGRQRTLGAGTHFVLPLVERVTGKTPTTGMSVVVDDLAAEDAHWQARVWYQLLDARAAGALPQLDGTVRDAAREAFADLQTHDGRSLKHAVNARLRGDGVLVARVELSKAA